MRTTLMVAAAALMINAGGAFAQAMAPGTAPAPASMPAAGSAPPSSGAMGKKVLSKACSAKADQQGLHGKARKRFRSACRAGKA